MGCAQSKPSTNSSPRGLQKLEMENGYVKAKYPEARRSTGQRYSGRIPRPEPRNGHSGRLGDGGGENGKLLTRAAKKDAGGGADADGSGSGSENIAKKMASLNLGGEEELVDGWPKWLTDNIPRDVLAGIVPRSAESYEKLAKVGQGTYSNVYKARDRKTGKIVALKKVRFDTSEPECVKFMAREIMILQKLDHPNIVKLEGLATSRMQYSLYLVFEFMQSDLSRIISRPNESLTEPQVKCYMQQLLSGLQHCHERGILHRDIKGSNLLIDRNGMLKIADFGLANYFNPTRKRHLTSRVVTLWYRAPELLLGATEYGIGIDLWSAGCLMAEMFAGQPIMPGRTEVEQLHRIFKLCGTPSEEYWKKLKVPPTFKPPHAYKSSFRLVFRDFPASSVGLLNILLDLDPAYRGCASSALQNEFFRTNPLACDLSGLPMIYKEEDEPIQTGERRSHKNSKLRCRSRTLQDPHKKDPTIEQPQGDFPSSKEEAEKSGDLNYRQGSSTATSASSSITHPHQNRSPPPSLSRDARKNMYLPPTPNAKTRSTKYNGDDDDNRYMLDQVQRSMSTREFRKLDQRKYLKLHVADD